MSYLHAAVNGILMQCSYCDLVSPLYSTHTTFTFRARTTSSNARNLQALNPTLIHDALSIIYLDTCDI